MLALTFDMSLASATANRPEEEPALKRSLWLTIARHIVQQHPSQDQVSHASMQIYSRQSCVHIRSCTMCAALISLL